MSRPIPDDAASEARTRVAHVRALREDGRCEVWLDGRRWLAKRATSCLVAPIEGDRVLLAYSGEEAFVLAILERDAAHSELRIEPDGDLVLGVERGRFSVAARDGVELASGRDLKLLGKTLDVGVATAELVCHTAQLVGRQAAIEFEGVKVISRFFDAIHDRLTSRAKRSLRIVEEADVLRAEAIDYSTSSTVRVHGKNAVYTAQQLVKMDGEQIQLG